MNVRMRIHWRIVKWFGLRKASKISKSACEIRLDLGCGALARAGFIGLDLIKTADLCWDLKWGIPFKENSIEEIRSDHFLEHLSLPHVVDLLRECHRVLRPGGRVEFTVPHIDPYLDAYMRRNILFLKEKIHDAPAGQEELYETCFDRLSWLLYRNGEHKSLFDKESILAKVKLAGFSIVRDREFDANKDVNQRFSSIYVVGVK